MENRYIELIAIEADNNFIYFKIGKQTHREIDFSSSGKSFKASNGVLLKSLVSPEYDPTFNTLFVKGMDEHKDNSILKCNRADFYLICEAITEYNKTDGAGYVKESIEDYYIISTDFTITELKFNNSDYDLENKKNGNFFRTREEAEKALKLFKYILKYKKIDGKYYI